MLVARRHDLNDGRMLGQWKKGALQCVEQWVQGSGVDSGASGGGDGRVRMVLIRRGLSVG